MTGCSDDGKSEFTFTLNDIDVCLAPGVRDQWSWTTIKRSDLEAFFTQNGFTFDPGKIDVVKFYSGTVSVDSPPGVKFNNIIEFDVYFRENSTSAQTKVAYVVGVTDNSVSVNLQNNFSELQSFFNMDSFQAGLFASRQDPTTSPLCVKGSIVLRVVVEN